MTWWDVLRLLVGELRPEDEEQSQAVGELARRASRDPELVAAVLAAHAVGGWPAVLALLGPDDG
ncbi:MAG TPA: hypothetical protein VHB21_11435 [Minicystis sp.]|nr:hypothetical protein [Minicystis sp.]